MELEGLLTIVLTLLMRCGYILIHIGCIPTTNVNNIYMSYTYNIGASSLVYLALGSTSALGEDWKGFIGVKWNNSLESQELLRGWSALMYSSTIIQLVTAGRIHFMGDVLVSFALSAIVHPVVYHSIWSPLGWMTNVKRVSPYPYEDVSGGAVIHLFSSSFALGALIIFGGRIININRLDHNSLAINSQITSVMGYLLVILSTMGLMLKSPLIPTLAMTNAQMNSIIALSTGLTMATLFYIPAKKKSYWTTIWTLQAGLASLICLAAGLGTYTKLMSFFYAFVGVALYLAASATIRISGLEDYCNIIAIHLLQGFLGAGLTAFNMKVMGYTTSDMGYKLLWQIICTTIIGMFGFLTAITILMIASIFNILRNSDEQKIVKEMSNFDIGCCLRVQRTLDVSTGDIIKPGFHTFLKFKLKKEDDSERPDLSNNIETFSREPTEI